MQTPTDIRAALHAHRSRLTGKVCSASECAQVKEKLRPCEVGWITDLMEEFPLAGTTFRILAGVDRSEIGGLVIWLTLEEMIGEALEVYPGITALKKGYFPIGIDATGGGDPYFVRCGGKPDRGFYRIRHDMVLEDDVALVDGAVELVLADLSEVFAHAIVEL